MTTFGIRRRGTGTSDAAAGVIGPGGGGRLRRRLRRPVGPGGGEAGSAVVELIGLGVVLLLPLTYVVLGALQVQQAAYGVTAAAQAAGRAYMLAPDGGSAPGAAFGAATVALADEGVVLAPGQLSLRCATGSGDCRSPGGAVRVEIAVRVSLPLVPEHGRHTSIGVDGVSVAPYGRYRATS